MGFLGDLFGKKKKDPEKNNKTTIPEDGSNSREAKDRSGTFVGFVLLREARWDKAETFRLLEEKWHITPDETGEDQEKEEDNMAVFWVKGTMVAISLMEAPVPNGEAEHYAAANFLWREAVEVTKTHTAHILVSVLGMPGTRWRRGNFTPPSPPAAWSSRRCWAFIPPVPFCRRTITCGWPKT